MVDKYTFSLLMSSRVVAPRESSTAIGAVTTTQIFASTRTLCAANHRVHVGTAMLSDVHILKQSGACTHGW